LERDTLIIFMNDNGGTAGVRTYNAGMRGSKGSPWLGGTRASSLWRWPGTLLPADCDRLAAHIDLFPTLAEIAAAKLSHQAKDQVEGRSLVPLLDDPKAAWDDRVLITHVGRWPKGADVEDHKYDRCSVRSARWHMVRDGNRDTTWQLFDVANDPGETTDVAAKYLKVVQKLDAAYDRWWASLSSYLVNEDAVGPKLNPFKELYWHQYGGSAGQFR
jgi:arylsulfatase